VEVEFRKSFEKDLNKLRYEALLTKIKAVILKVEDTGNLDSMSNIKKLKAEGDYYRIRVGDYRSAFYLMKMLSSL